MAHLWIKELTFSGGSRVVLNDGDLVLLVGPNNSGKSSTLRAIRSKLRSGDGFKSPILESLQSVRVGSAQDVTSWLETFAATRDGRTGAFQALDAETDAYSISQFWHNQHPLNNVADFFCRVLEAAQRLEIANPPDSFHAMRETPKHPIQFLLRNEELEQTLSHQFHEAFGQDLILNRLAGNRLPLHIGLRSTLPPTPNRLDSAYVEAVDRLPMLHQQGDGMKSFASILLYASVGKESVLAIDEPEAFLHPPQARLLGRMLVENKPATRQTFLATHSGDVLRGTLDVPGAKVQVVRLTRDGNETQARQLDPAAVADLWKDPLLRYSNILDGLFHEGVVVCEADSDARYYAAVADALFADGQLGSRRPDWMFVHAGGKQRSALVVSALRRVGVTVRVVLDFDVLNAEYPLRVIVESAGGDWATFAGDWQQVKKAIDDKKADLSCEEVKTRISEVLVNATGKTFPDASKAAIQQVFKQSSPWAIAKTCGRSYVPAGNAFNAYLDLHKKLLAIGIHLVEVGELECFDSRAGNHGPTWVNEALQYNLSSDPELRAVRAFVATLVAQ